ncbi:MAG: hypothetical protein V4595_06960 [Pseudomonadota bacterium]|jgi:hypothetical protein
MPNLHDPAKLVPARLGPKAPLGYFRSFDMEANATEFWIVERDGVRSAIILKASDPKWAFEAFVLDDDDAAWTGIGLGPVEVMVDLDAGSFVDVPRFAKGAISITGGKVYVSAVPSGRLGSRVTFMVGTSVDVSDEGTALFTKWQLVQRDHEGRPVVVFEQD